MDGVSFHDSPYHVPIPPSVGCHIKRTGFSLQLIASGLMVFQAMIAYVGDPSGGLS